ncbi:hypothetical protein DHEL01_v200680 [Diaporthe helianthi]|uniref:Uncharacterized protein n=1 Tax=Diaporthe helianthi TaxID=158607 RepID=A0A2P5IEH8_DIAHE|nr:hypothetical protein DHEL01_v200680 [Diaporthe helianthi]
MLRKLVLALCSVSPVALAFTFVSPASHGGQTSFTKNIVYTEKSKVQIEWTVGDDGQDATVVLWQVDLRTSLATDDIPETLGDLEYIAEGQAFDRNTRNWIVTTEKDLTTSPVFMMTIFVTGATTSDDNSVYFNISSADPSKDSVSASDTIPASIPNSSSVPSPATTALASGLPSASSTAESSPALSSPATIGLGVAIPAAAILGIGAGWLAFRRGKPQGSPPPPASLLVPSQEDKSEGFRGPSVASPKSQAASSITAYGPPPGVPAYGPPSNAPTYKPEFSEPVYEASSETVGPSELYTPYNVQNPVARHN